ncbi:diacylglycerol kinase [Tepiditoga spiralis]|uniref:Diacylglycerol kinase n=1 Tax=Tepiditoga spiralis TaxID=2108365 RepID=A0A7G1G699_9BACT|nr:diacylglycerol kinase family protein [Tepiditoga spiralis]BBE31961.1 diacylglycerol kinase [Tepiditoga spiralis]
MMKRIIGTKKFKDSLKFAINGLFEVHKTQRNFRIQTFIGLIALITALFLDLNGVKLLWISFAVMLVLLMEALNTVIEKVLDYLHPDYSEIIGIIKDISAAVVLIASVFSIVIGTIIFGESIFKINPKYGIIIAIAFLVFIKFFSRGGKNNG